MAKNEHYYVECVVKVLEEFLQLPHLVLSLEKGSHISDSKPTTTMSGDDESSNTDKYDSKEFGKDGGSLAGNKRSLPDKSIDELTAEELASADLNEFELDPEKRREVRKMRRVMANRRSARESRERRKKLLTDLQESVESLTSDNANLSKENLALRRELATLIEQSGGAASLSMIPNIQSLLQSTQGQSGLAMPGGAAMGNVDGNK